MPWPWTINADGRGHWLATRAAAIGLARDRIAEGSTRFDVGCFQLNVKWHGRAFDSLDDMIDPARNARYAARFLASLKAELGEGIARFGSALVPMDEALVEAAIDVGGRPYYVGKLPSKLYTHFLHSFATNLDATLHVRVVRGSDRHHVVEAAIKATGMALRHALAPRAEVFSTKGAVKSEKVD